MIACSPKNSIHIEVSRVSFKSSIYFLGKNEYTNYVACYYVDEEFERVYNMPTLYIFDQDVLIQNI